MQWVNVFEFRDVLYLLSPLEICIALHIYILLYLCPLLQIFTCTFIIIYVHEINFWPKKYEKLQKVTVFRIYKSYFLPFKLYFFALPFGYLEV